MKIELTKKEAELIRLIIVGSVESEQYDVSDNKRLITVWQRLKDAEKKNGY